MYLNPTSLENMYASCGGHVALCLHRFVPVLPGLRASLKMESVKCELGNDPESQSTSCVPVVQVRCDHNMFFLLYCNNIVVL